MPVHTSFATIATMLGGNILSLAAVLAIAYHATGLAGLKERRLPVSFK